MQTWGMELGFLNNNFVRLFIYFFPVLGLCCCTGFSLVAENGAHSLVSALGSSLQWLLQSWSTGSVVVEPGLLPPQRVGSSWARD